MQENIHNLISTILNRLNTSFEKIKIDQDEHGTYRVNIESQQPNLLIGYRGENIWALQHIIKLILWRNNEEINIFIDVDNYRKRQEQNIISLALKKVDTVRKLKKSQALPSMSAYHRRLIHLHLAQEQFSDIITESQGSGKFRYVIIKPKRDVQI